MVARKLHGWRPKGWLQKNLYLMGELEREARRGRRGTRRYKSLMGGAEALENFTAEGLVVEMGYSESDLVDAGFSPEAVEFAVLQSRGFRVGRSG